MFLCVYYLRRVIACTGTPCSCDARPRPRSSNDIGSLLVSGRSATDAAFAKLKESNLRFAMSEVSKRKPIAARRMDTAQAQHPFAISVSLVNDHAFDTQL